MKKQGEVAVVGIDLGTERTCIGLFVPPEERTHPSLGHVEIVQNKFK